VFLLDYQFQAIRDELARKVADLSTQNESMKKVSELDLTRSTVVSFM
jgi:hypothetical protein